MKAGAPSLEKSDLGMVRMNPIPQSPLSGAVVQIVDGSVSKDGYPGHFARAGK